MTTIEYNKVKISVPTGWQDITVGHYESFNKYEATTHRERIAVMAKVCKVDVELLTGWPAEIFNMIVDLTAFLFIDFQVPASATMKIDGVTYAVPIEDDLTLGEWVDLDEAQKKETDIISGVLAIVCRPVGEKYDFKRNDERAAMFAGLPVSDIQGVLAFFLLCKTAYDKRTDVFMKLAQASGLLHQSIKNFLKGGAGIKSLLNWRTVKYFFSTVLLYSRLQRCLSSYYTERTRRSLKPRNVS